jgi:hypothetical protein
VTTNRSIVRRSPRGALTYSQELELWLGPSRLGSAFDSREELREAWLKHRDRLMAMWAKNGRRPQGWWAFESPIPFPGYDNERSKLHELDLLGAAEAAALVSMWRREFERAQVANFSLTLSPGHVLKGAAAREAHLRWADVPSALVEQWSEERRHPIRALEEASPAETTASESAV